MADRVLLGERLRRARKAEGLTLREVSVRTGLGYQYISELERGNGNPTLGALESIAAASGNTCEVVFEKATGEKLKADDVLLLDELRRLLPAAPTDAKQAVLVMLRLTAAAPQSPAASE